jgi:hypothetical protein
LFTKLEPNTFETMIPIELLIMELVLIRQIIPTLATQIGYALFWKNKHRTGIRYNLATHKQYYDNSLQILVLFCILKIVSLK